MHTRPKQAIVVIRSGARIDNDRFQGYLYLVSKFVRSGYNLRGWPPYRYSDEFRSRVHAACSVSVLVFKISLINSRLPDSREKQTHQFGVQPTQVFIDTRSREHVNDSLRGHSPGA